jgi:hypothetical protein
MLIEIVVHQEGSFHQEIRVVHEVEVLVLEMPTEVLREGQGRGVLYVQQAAVSWHDGGLVGHTALRMRLNRDRKRRFHQDSVHHSPHSTGRLGQSAELEHQEQEEPFPLSHQSTPCRKIGYD